MVTVSLEAWANMKRANQGLADLIKSKAALVQQLQRTNTSLVRESSQFQSENEELKAIIADQNKELLTLRDQVRDLEYVSYAG